MPPHLHPRSTATSTLFAGTLLASFIVVAIPHLVPCPRPNTRNQLNSEMKLDENGRPVRRVRRQQAATKSEESDFADRPGVGTGSSMNTAKTLSKEAAMFQQLQQEAEVLRAEAVKDRECPVPKPRGALGRWLGFDGDVRAQVGKD